MPDLLPSYVKASSRESDFMKRGTNQYKEKYKYPLNLRKNVFWDVIWLSIVVLLLLAILAILQWPTNDLISPIPKNYLPTITKIVFAKETDDIAGYIGKVFGEYAQEAHRVAYCESKLRPDAIGDNGKSYGLFQISIRWHKIAPKFLLNYKINTQVAYQLFKENKFKWNLWSCKPY
jgi:hypothetical protein